MKFKIVFTFFTLMTAGFAMDQRAGRVNFYTSDNFGNCPFSWKQIKQSHEVISRALYGNGFVDKRQQLLDTSFVHNESIFGQGKSTLGLLTSTTSESTRFEGSITYLNNQDAPTIIQIIAKSIEGYGEMIGSVLGQYPDAQCLQIALPSDNPFATLFASKMSTGAVQKVDIPVDAVAKENQHNAVCFSLQRSFVPMLLSELPQMMQAASKQTQAESDKVFITHSYSDFENSLSPYTWDQTVAFFENVTKATVPFEQHEEALARLAKVLKHNQEGFIANDRQLGFLIELVGEKDLKIVGATFFNVDDRLLTVSQTSAVSDKDYFYMIARVIGNYAEKGQLIETLRTTIHKDRPIAKLLGSFVSKEFGEKIDIYDDFHRQFSDIYDAYSISVEGFKTVLAQMQK